MKYLGLTKKGVIQYVSICPKLNICSQGYSHKEAILNLTHAVNLYLNAKRKGNIYKSNIPFKLKRHGTRGPMLPELSGMIIVKALSRAGFHKVSQNNKHILLKMKRGKLNVNTIIPLHNKVDTETLKEILNEIGIGPRKFIEMLKKTANGKEHLHVQL